MNYGELIRDAMNKMDKLIKTARTEKRDLTDEEQTVFDSLEKDIEKYKAGSVREEKINQIKTDLETNVTPIPRTEVKNKETGFKTFGEFLTAVKNFYQPNGMLDNRLMGSTERIENIGTGMSVSVSADGGFMVGTQFEKALMETIMGQSLILPRIWMIPISADNNGIALPALAETSRANGSRWGGVSASWAGEGGTVAATKPKIREIDLKLSKLLAFCYMTEELMRDARAMEAFVRKAYAEEMSFKLDDAIINGDGLGKPLGIMNCPALVTVAKEAGQGADTIVYQNIVKMWSRMPARSRPRAVWLINQECETELSSMVLTAGTSGSPVYLPAGGISGQPFGTIYGRPVLPIEQAAKLGDAGDIILADLSDYIGIDKGGLETDASIHVQFLYDEQTFRFRYRFNGTPYSNSPLTSKANASFTLSPYVTLAAR